MSRNLYPDNYYDIIIIGGGASGFFLASCLTEHFAEKRILILEKTSRPMQKLLQTGNGQCNFTNAQKDKNIFLSNYPRGKNFLKKSFYAFDNYRMNKWLNNHNIKTEQNDEGKLFPLSRQAKDIFTLFFDVFHKNKFNGLIEQANIESLIYIPVDDPANKKNSCDSESGKDIKFEIIYSVGKKIHTLYCNFCILAPGGIRNGLSFRTNMDIKLVSGVPALYGFSIAQPWGKSLSGISLESVNLKIENTRFTSSGPLIFTHQGISGPAALHLSSLAAYEIRRLNFQFNLSIDFIPGIQYNDSIRILEELKLEKPSLEFKNSFFIFNLPSRFYEAVILSFSVQHKITGLFHTKFKDIKKRILSQFIDYLKNCPFSVTNKSSIQNEFITAGGLKLDQLNSRSLSFNNYPELYATGEILDIDGYTGGYNLQICWSTAHAVYEDIKNKTRANNENKE